ncbi:hypothetical protein ACWGRK_02405 [Saccharomonospora azurea]
MSWQEELRRLDTELAAGTITSSEHRRRREDILAEVSGAPLTAFARSSTASGTATAESSQASTDSPATSEPSKPSKPSEPSEPSAAPDTPPSSTDSSADHPSGDEPTSTTPDSSASSARRDGGAQWAAANPASAQPEPGADRKPTPAAASLLSTTRPTTAPSPADERPTELLRRIDFSTPPPTAPGSDDDNDNDGGERGRRTGLTWVAISGAVFLALGAVIGGAWWLGQDRSEAPPASVDSGTGAPGSGAADGDTAQGGDRPALEDRVPVLPGTPSPNDSTLAVDKGVELSLYPEHSAQILTDHGVNEVVHRASTDGDTGYFLLVIPTPDAERATSLTTALSELVVNAGFTTVEDVEGGLTGQIGDRTLRGTWYTSDTVVVNLWVSQPTPADEAQLATLTTETVEALQAEFPPS